MDSFDYYAMLYDEYPFLSRLLRCFGLPVMSRIWLMIFPHTPPTAWAVLPDGFPTAMCSCSAILRHMKQVSLQLHLFLPVQHTSLAVPSPVGARVERPQDLGPMPMRTKKFAME